MCLPFSWFKGKLLFSLKKLSSSLFDDTDWFQWNSIPFKVQNSTATVIMVEVTVYCFFETTLSLISRGFAQVGIFVLRHLFSWFCLYRCHRCPDVADVRCLVFPPWRQRCHWYHDPSFQQIAPGLLIDPPPLLDDLCGRHHFSPWLHFICNWFSIEIQLCAKDATAA